MFRPVDPALVEQFLTLCGTSASFPEADFKRQRLSFFRAVLDALASLPPDAERDTAVCGRIVALLTGAKRFFDIASLYAAAKKRHGGERGLDAAFRTALTDIIHDLFIVTLTYHSPELDVLFCETLGADRERFIDLLGTLFERRRLYTMRLSPAIQDFFYTIVDENVRHFVQHANPHFLAFYLSTLRDLPRRTDTHLDKWVSLLLAPTTSRDIIDKVIGAMRLNPVAEILIILILLARDEQRSEALSLLNALIERRPYLLREQRGALAMVLDRAFASHFYDIHRIPREQKNSLASLALFTEHPSPFERMRLLLTEPNPLRDPKRTDTKRICASALARFGTKEPRHIAHLRGLLRNGDLEEGVRQEILYLLRQVASPEEEITLIMPIRPSENEDEEKTLVSRFPE